MHQLLVRACVAGVLLLFSPIDAGVAQTEECLQQARRSASQRVWSSILEYFQGLPFTRKETEDRAKLTRLRSEIVLLQSEKLRLISLLESQIRESATSERTVTSDLSIEDIPLILSSIDDITRQMQQIADEGNLFTAQDAFKELLMSFSLRRTSILCEIAVQADAPEQDLARMRSLLLDLRMELGVISAAEEALARFIRESG